VHRQGDGHRGVGSSELAQDRAHVAVGDAAAAVFARHERTGDPEPAQHVER
jgi:hypothetical protein